MAKKTAKKKDDEKASASTLELVDYSERAVALFGNSKAIKDHLKAIGGRFNPHLTNPETKETQAGWIFPKTKEYEVKGILADL